MVITNMPSKRSREVEFDRQTETPNSLLSLPRSMQFGPIYSRVYECDTCNLQFTSPHAFSGHFNGHKRMRVGADLNLQPTQLGKSHERAKTRICTLCGLESGVCQALGGHMSMHGATMNESDKAQSFYGSDSGLVDQIVEKSDGKRRVLAFDLNLTPLENMELGLKQLGLKNMGDYFR